MKRVLAVSGDAQFLERLLEANAKSHLYQLVTARTTWDALAELRLRPATLAILDFPSASGEIYQLLAEIHRDHPALPVLGATQTQDVAIERRARQMGLVRMVSRTAPAESILREVDVAVDTGPVGHVTGLHLSSLLQVLYWERKHCVARIHAGGREGVLYLERGFLVHAVSGVLSGEDAALEILGWEDPRVEFFPAEPITRSILTPLAELLLLAAHGEDVTDTDALDLQTWKPTFEATSSTEDHPPS